MKQVNKIPEVVRRAFRIATSGRPGAVHLALPQEVSSGSYTELKDNLYADCIAHPNVARVVALSGGYSRDEANDRLSRQHGMVASFSRALSEGLNAKQSDAEFDKMLDESIASIFAASKT